MFRIRPHSLRIWGGLIAITLFGSIAGAQPSAPTVANVTKIPFDAPAIKYGDLELTIGYFLHYNQGRLSQLRNEDEAQRKEAIQDIVKNCIFERLITAQALKEDYDKDPFYVVKNRDMEYDWLTRFYVYHQFYLPYKANDEEVQKEYDANKKDYYKPLTFSFRHIFFRTIDMAEDVQKIAKDRAAKALALIHSGSDFEAVAKEFSDSDKKGTLLGPLYTRKEKPDQAINIQLEEELLKMKAGDVSDIIQTRFGYEILKLETLTPETYTPLEQVRISIENKLRKIKIEDLNKELVDKNWDKTVKEYHPEAIFDEKADPNTVIAVVYGEKITKDDYDKIQLRPLQKPEDMDQKAFEEKTIEDLKYKIIFRYIAGKLAKDLGYEKIPGYIVYSSVMRDQNTFSAWWKKLSDRWVEEHPITEEEKRDYVEKNPKEFLQRPQSRIAEMSFKIPPYDEKDKYAAYKAQEAAMDKANKALERVKAGEKFADVAREMSESDSASKSGEVGLISSDSEALPRYLITSAMNLAAGEFSKEPLKEGDRYYVLGCLEKPEPKAEEYDHPAVQKHLERVLTNKRRSEAFDETMKKTVDPDKIEILYKDIYTFDPRFVERVSLDPVK
ncbi:MAG: peptidyl-prolyl cis-trans isomerase [Candidatus Omnitrophota bacterium]